MVYARRESHSDRIARGDGISPSSRVSEAGAGWGFCDPAGFESPPDGCGGGEQEFSWLDPRPLWDSRNEVVARLLGDPTNERRRRWLAHIGADAADRVVSDFDGEQTAFVLVGDTGEGDASQYAVVAPLLSRSEGAEFLFLCSDLVYPAGGIEEFGRKVLCPYRKFPGPIFGIPGNHDWYDDADGFMYWFCGARKRPGRARRMPLSRRWMRDRLWRSSPQARAEELGKIEALRSAPRQPGPYFAIDAGPLRLVAIDSGLGGPIDRDQGAWLRQVSAGPRPKILLTGKPLFANGRRLERPIEGGGGTVNAIVADAANGYVGSIGGDVHNYQRYLVPLKDGRRQLHIVSGGGGAFMHETHTIGRIDPDRCGGVREEDFRLYPLRGDSLARYSQLYGRRLGALGRLLVIPPDSAAAITARRIGVEPTRGAARRAWPRPWQRASAAVLRMLPGRARGPLQFPLSLLLDWNDPPLFKHFLRVETVGAELHVRCYGVSGCRDAELRPPVEDHLVGAPDGDGRWDWTIAGPA
jgi:hypothetical protein